jgi:flagellum-specific peptidoglycan hydrolase FlgJ
VNRIDFIGLMAPLAMADQNRTAVLASITIAQGILESASGASAPGNNLFGIKGIGQELNTKEFINGEWVTIKDGFRVYDSWSESISDHSSFLLVNTRYTRSGFFERCKALDYKGAAQALQNAGYATDPQYATKLIALIEQYKLHQYDLEAKVTMEDMVKRIEILESKVAQLLNAVRVLEPTPPPQWFVDEFGVASIAGIIHDPNGDVDFWRNTAVTLRLMKR